MSRWRPTANDRGKALHANLVVLLRAVTEEVNRRWHEANKGALSTPARMFIITNRLTSVMDSFMRPAKHCEFASAILIDTLGRLLLQECDNFPGVLQPGTIGLFGGHREDNETYLQCVAREVHEEIRYFLPRESFEHPTSYDGKDIDCESGTVHGEFFVARGIPSLGRKLLCEAHASISVASTEKMLVRQQRLNLRMVEKFAHELGKRRADLQPIAVLHEGRRVPHRVVGRKSHEPAVQEIVANCSMSWRSDRMP